MLRSLSKCTLGFFFTLNKMNLNIIYKTFIFNWNYCYQTCLLRINILCIIRKRKIIICLSANLNLSETRSISLGLFYFQVANDRFRLNHTHTHERFLKFGLSSFCPSFSFSINFHSQCEYECRLVLYL